MQEFAVWDTGACARALHESLREAGLTCRLVEAEAWPADAVALVVAAGHGLEDLLRFDHVAYGRRSCWLPILGEEARVLIGPVFSAGALCFSCLFRRLQAASPTPWATGRRWIAGFAPPTKDSAWLEVTTAECARLKAGERRLLGGRLAVAAGRPPVWQPVLRVPGCLYCDPA